jgi:membrane dipeptidase
VTATDARALHDEVAAIDLHADTPKIMRAFEYDLSRRHDPPLPRSSFMGHVDLPRLREGGMAAQWFGLWTFPYPRTGCAASVNRQLDALEDAAAKNPDELALCRSYEDVVAARRAGRIAGLTGIEGGQALEGQLERVDEFARRGVRYLGLLHFSANELGRPAFGVGRDDSLGLTAFGRDVVAEMNRCGMIVDLAHINRKGFFDALEASRAPCIVSHTGVTGAHEHWRNIDDEQLRAVARRGGVVGIIFAPRYLGGRGIEAVVAHLEHVVKVAGEDAVALGSDYDGMITPVRGLEDVSRMPALTAALLARGMTRDAVKKLLGENAMRVIRDVPPRWSQPAPVRP